MVDEHYVNCVYMKVKDEVFRKIVANEYFKDYNKGLLEDGSSQVSLTGLDFAKNAHQYGVDTKTLDLAYLRVAKFA